MADVSASAAVGVRPMRADARRNYDRLVEAARAVFAARGSEASIDEIARTADVGVGTLYRHFPRRIDLVEAVYREDVDTLVARGEALLAQAGPWDALTRWLEAFVAYAAAKRTFLTELHEAFEKNPDLAVSSREKIGAATGRLLARAQEAGVVRPDISQGELMQLVGGMCMARGATEEQNLGLLTFVLDGIRPR
jgi:AcrR family transcriptional regulator